MNLSLIYSSTINNAISFNGKLLDCPVDKRHFYRVTTYSPDNRKNLMIVGRVTYESLPDKMKQCDYRDYVVFSRNALDNTITFNSFDKILAYAFENKHKYYKTFVIGGAMCYRAAEESGWVYEVFHTLFLTNPPLSKPLIYYCDESKMALSSKSMLNSQSQQCDMEIKHLIRNHEPFEIQYMRLLNKVVMTGDKRATRNGHVISLSNQSYTIDLADGFPLLTIRKIFWKGIKEELLWFMRGSTNVAELRKVGVRIWDGNSSREYLDQYGLTNLQQGDIGPGYGFQMRHAGADYVDCNTDYGNAGVDQLTDCVNKIKRDPFNRRIIINLWNVNQINQMALPPCHLLYQFTVRNGKLSCHLYQRSWDIMLGWNISTAALLTHLMAHYCDLGVGLLTHSIGDVHIYFDHLQHVDTLEKRMPFKLPTLECIGPVPQSIDGYSSDQIKLVNYICHQPISMKMFE